MSWSLTKIVGLVIIPLMIASAIMASLQSINTNTIQPKGEELETEIQNYGRAVPVGKGADSEEEAEEQLKGAIIVNQIQAWNCAIPPGVMGGEAFNSQVSHGDRADKNIAYHVYGRDNDEKRLFRYLYLTGSFPVCSGAEKIDLPNVNLDVALGDLAVTAVTGFAGLAVKKLIEHAEDIANFVTCDTTKAMSRMSGKDMEGIYGRIDLNFRKTVKLGEDTHKLWDANVMRQSSDTGCFLQDSEREIQALWTGQDTAEYLPFPNMDDKPVDTKMTLGLEERVKKYMSSQGGNGGTPIEGGRERFTNDGLADQIGSPGNALAGEVVIDAPLIVPDGTLSGNNLPDDLEDENAYYLFCEGAEGFVQTNTIAPGHEGESTKQSTETIFGVNTEDFTGQQTVTYTYVMVTKNRKSCFEENNIGDSHTTEFEGIEVKYWEEG